MFIDWGLDHWVLSRILFVSKKNNGGEGGLIDKAADCHGG